MMGLPALATPGSEPGSTISGAAQDDRMRPRVVVVGPCASGKSTLVSGLRSLGYRAAVCGQEHSEVPTLWRRSAPDMLVALQVDLATVRRRRGDGWSEAIFERQRQRLANALASADLVLEASTLSEAAVLARVLRALELAGLAADADAAVRETHPET